MSQPSGQQTRTTTPLARPLAEIVLTFRQFAHLEASSGILILASAVVALLLANSPMGELYAAIWQQHITVGVTGLLVIDESLGHWINDGLMAVFFFVVGLEIKREIAVGELSSPRNVLLPLLAAIGGMVVPAALYTLVTIGTPEVRGWGIPMATDIAFALGIMSLVGKRVPLSLKIFLTTFAIIDDIGAILVIALFYSSGIALEWLALGFIGLVAALLLNRGRVYAVLPYFVIGLFVWLAFLESGVHPTIAGVAMAFTIPGRVWLDRPHFLDDSRHLLDEMDRYVEDDEVYRSGIATLETLAEQAQSPLQRLENTLHPWSAFLVLPLFALANAGVVVPDTIRDTMTQGLTVAIVAGLVIGKQIGIVGVTWISVRLGLTQLPEGLGWRHIYAAGWLAGIGFTVSLFIAELAFAGSDAIVNAKLGVLAGSAVSAIGGLALLAVATSFSDEREPQTTA